MGEEEEVQPTPDEDDDVQPTPDEDDDVQPTPDEDDDDEPTPDEGEEVDPIPDEDDVEPTPDEDEEMDNNDNAINSQEDFDNWAWTRDVWENRKIWETSDMNCVEESCEDDECNALFKISPANPRLGVAFDGQGEEVNFRFETERWAPCVE